MFSPLLLLSLVKPKVRAVAGALLLAGLAPFLLSGPCPEPPCETQVCQRD